MLTRIRQFIRTRRRGGDVLASESKANNGSSQAGGIDIFTQLEKAQAAWLKEMAAFRGSTGCVQLPLVPMLTEEHLENCRLLANREAILKRMKKGGIAVEVGVQTGRFSQAILDYCQPRRLHLIDLDLHAFSIGEKFKPAIEVGHVILHEGDSAQMLSEFADAYFDFIYVDANHSYPGVKRDIEAAKSKLKPDGYFIFNDYTYWSPAECMPYGVMRAVNELCLEDGFEMLYFALADYMYCDVALRRRGCVPLTQSI